MRYFRDVDSGNIVRKKEDKFQLEYIQKNYLIWQETTAGSSYEREFYFGEGNTCLFDITREEAQKILNSWGYKEDIEQ